jgi:hypothetical protein
MFGRMVGLDISTQCLNAQFAENSIALFTKQCFEMVPTNEEPRSASEYTDRISAAVRSVLVEIGQTLGSYRGKFAVIGGAFPWLLLEESEMKDVGTADIDLSLDAEALAEDEQYAELVVSLREQGYETRAELRNFRMVRTVDPGDGGGPIDIHYRFSEAV